MPETQVMWSAEQVGQVAGQVWQCLRMAGRASLSDVEKDVDAPKQITMAIGWLAREGKVELRQHGNAVQVWLTE